LAALEQVNAADAARAGHRTGVAPAHHVEPATVELSSRRPFQSRYGDREAGT
jgi:hypothetical protein